MKTASVSTGCIGETCSQAPMPQRLPPDLIVDANSGGETVRPRLLGSWHQPDSVNSIILRLLGIASETPRSS